MSTTTARTRFSPNEGRIALSKNTVTGTTDVTEWIFLTGPISIQVTGVATAITAKLERSTENPTSSTANPVVVGADITGNPSTGIYRASDTEAGSGWWRVRLTALTGASAVVYISGTEV
jgi:hypothetical protein